MYYFDFNTERCKSIFNEWLAAEINGMFGSQAQAASEQIQGHRYDESVMAMCLYRNGSEPVNRQDAQYNDSDNSLLIKKHFK